MSRHTFSVGDRTVAYGFDRPLSEYFVTLYKDGDPVGNATGYAGRVFEKLEEFGVTLPADHAGDMALDVPIRDEKPREQGTIQVDTFGDAAATFLADE